MKKLSLSIILHVITSMMTIKTEAQVTTQSILNSPAISKNDLIGLWQINTPQIGANPLESFQFLNDGTFIYNYDSSDDTRKIIKLKGTFIIKGNELFFTIKSRTERLSNNIVTGAIGTDENIFVFDSDSKRTVIEKKPRQLDPVGILYLKKISKYFRIKINNRTYFKISSSTPPS